MKRSILLGLFFSFISFPESTVLAQRNCPLWKSILPEGTVRYDHVMAYDSARHVFVITGGEFYSRSSYSKDWTIEWDGNGTIFATKDLYTFAKRPNSAMVFDDIRKVSVLFGGVFHTEDPQSAVTWTWDGNLWTHHDSGELTPRYGHAMAYDWRRGVTVLFGGAGGVGPGTIFGDTWEWDGTSWNQVATIGPVPRVYHAMAFDSTRGVTVLFGGYGGYGIDEAADLNDTWEWDGKSWELRTFTGPSPRDGHAMAFDERSHMTI
ncbi:MAG: hypothetical protein HYR83_14540 [Planctomycetes bacterium]|nr:hypothetical protein [Planctomycetota bacterium]